MSIKQILLAAAFLPNMLSAQTTPERPPITGIAHAAIYCSDVDATRNYLKDYFGFDESIKYDNPDGSTKLSALKINERQIIELFPEKEADSDRLLHYAIETTDAEAMRRYLKANGYDVPDKVDKIDMGIINFFMTDPTGHLLEFVQYTDDGDFGRTRGLYLSNARVSNHMSHLGFYVPDREKAEDFFCNTLGFLSEWKGGPEPGKVQWILMRTPEGDDAIELILSDNETPSKEELLFDNHICLEVINLENTLETLSKREFPDNVPVPGKLSLTKSKIRMINYALPDGTRFELMEEQPYDNIKAESL